MPEELDDQIASTAFCVIRADRRKAAPHFLYYAVSTNQFIDNIARVESGASYPAVNDKDVLDSRLWLPPITEQDIIAAVLRRNQKSIDVQNRLIVSARDLKQTVMGQLFSRGVREQTNKQTPFGEIPASWQVLPLGECSEVQTGVTKGRAISPDEAIEVPYLRVANVQDGHLDLGEIKTITIRQSEIHTFLLQPGDVVLTEGGDFDKLGRGFIWRGEINPCVHQNHIFAVRAAADVLLPEFLAYLVQSPYGRSYFLTVAHKTTNLASINSTKLKAFPVPLPPLDEQRAIISTLQAIDRKIDVHERKRATLKELFNALLDELMTGRIRVADLDIDLDTAAVAKSQEAP
ncbi:MAG: restriction endonuclease subunit S [Gemmatimonadota bacterium]